MAAAPAPARPPKGTPLLRLTGVSRIYPMGEVEVAALAGADLTLDQGEFVVLFGPSGSGKSTLLNLIGGIDSPTHGEVFFGDEKLEGEVVLERHRRRRIGFVFQFYNLIPTLTAIENVELAALLAEHPMDPLEALREVGLAERRDHFPSQLSGGEQQRVSIARALVKRPSLLLCDEPTGALDLPTGRKVLRILRDINLKQGATVVVVTHNGALAHMADRVVYLRGGRIAETSRVESPIEPEAVTW